ncbi:MAG: Xaa-Pro peptidase family protein [Bacillota bacterium]|nr:Xaa-Pro peptidase family protein [Bacillota bacterium]
MDQRLNTIRRKMIDNNVEAFLITHRSNIIYLSGFTGTSGFLLVTSMDALLFTDFRYLEQAGEQAPAFEVMRVESSANYSAAAQFISKKGLNTLALEEAHFSLREYNQLKGSHPRIKIVSLYNFVEEIRVIKEEKEVGFIAAAARIADQALQNVLPLLKPGISELEVSYELEYQLRKGGSEKLPFEIIVASGERSALPHGVAGKRIINAGELVTIDFGAVYSGYCSDMTRTFVLGAPHQKQQEIYDLVLQGVEMATRTVRAGQRCDSVDGLVRQFFEKEGYGACFGHGLGHGVGLEVHELPTLSPKGQELLEEMMIFTIEPGIYIGGWGGIRIEDLVVLRPEGLQILTESGKEFVLG